MCLISRLLCCLLTHTYTHVLVFVGALKSVSACELQYISYTAIYMWIVIGHSQYPTKMQTNQKHIVVCASPWAANGPPSGASWRLQKPKKSSVLIMGLAWFFGGSPEKKQHAFIIFFALKLHTYFISRKIRIIFQRFPAHVGSNNPNQREGAWLPVALSCLVYQTISNGSIPCHILFQDSKLINLMSSYIIVGLA